MCLKCIKILLAAGLRPDPLGKIMRSSRALSRNGGLLLKRRRVREEEGLISKKDRRGREEKGGGKGNSLPKSSSLE